MHAYLKFIDESRRAAFMTSAELEAISVGSIIEHNNVSEDQVEFRVSYRSASDVQHAQLVELGQKYGAKSCRYLTNDHGRYAYGFN